MRSTHAESWQLLWRILLSATTSQPYLNAFCWTVCWHRLLFICSIRAPKALSVIVNKRDAREATFDLHRAGLCAIFHDLFNVMLIQRWWKMGMSYAENDLKNAKVVASPNELVIFRPSNNHECTPETTSSSTPSGPYHRFRLWNIWFALVELLAIFLLHLAVCFASISIKSGPHQ